MKKTLLEFYALLVSFVCVIGCVVTLCITLYSLVGLANPGFTLSSYDFSSLQTNEAYWRKITDFSSDSQPQRPNEATLTAQRLEAREAAISGEHLSNLQTLVKCLIVLVITLVTLRVHWKMARRAREAA